MGDGMLSLNWNNHKSTIFHILSILREKERYTDVSLACQGKFYQVHKLVLSACSEYFESIFENTPCKHPVIVLKDIKSDDLEALLSYMYEGVVSVAQNDLARLIKVAELLQIKGLAIPDEPPPSPENINVRESKDDRKSPPSKRKKCEENNQVDSPSSSPKRTQYQDTEYQPRSSRSKLFKDSQRSDSPLEPESTEPEVMVIVDEPLVKEEIPVKDEVQEIPYDKLGNKEEDSQFYSADIRDSSLDSIPQNEDVSSLHDSPTKLSGYPHLLEGVEVEAIAGPSGMQGWLSGDLGNQGAENYGDGENSHQQMAMKQLQSMHQNWSSALPGGCGSSVVDFEFERTPQGFLCPFCQKSTFKKPSDIKQHILTHTGEKPFKCPYCDFCSNRTGNMKKHILKKHHDLAPQMTDV